MSDQTQTIADQVFELADAIVNQNGYADDADESDARADARDDLATVIDGTIKAWQETHE